MRHTRVPLGGHDHDDDARGDAASGRARLASAAMRGFRQSQAELLRRKDKGGVTGPYQASELVGGVANQKID
jgi:hypothetical protein